MGSSIARVCPVMLIPINLLRGVQIDLRQKLAVAGIFSLTLFIIAVAIMRVTLNSTNKSTLDLSLINLWAVLEMTVGASTLSLHAEQYLLSPTPTSPHASPPSSLSSTALQFLPRCYIKLRLT